MVDWLFPPRVEDLSPDPIVQTFAMCSPSTLSWADGAMGTTLHGYELYLDDFEGYEIRNVTRPDVVCEAYFAVGVECVETTT